MDHDCGGEGAVGGLPIVGFAASQVGNEAGYVYHHVAVEEAGGEFHVADVGGAGVFVVALQVVDDGEVVAFRLFGVDGEGVGDVDGGVDVCAGVGGDHAAKEGAFEAAGEAGLTAKGDEVVALFIAAGRLEQQLGGCGGGLHVVGVILANALRLPPEVLDFGQAEEQGLAAGFGGAAAGVNGDVEFVLDGLQEIVGELVGVPEGLNHLALNDIAGADCFFCAGDAVNGEFVVSHAPVTLEALGGDAGANRAAKGETLGEAAMRPGSATPPGRSAGCGFAGIWNVVIYKELSLSVI